MRSVPAAVTGSAAGEGATGARAGESFESLRRMSVAVDALAAKDPAELDDAALAERLAALGQLLGHLEAEGARCRAALEARHGR